MDFRRIASELNDIANEIDAISNSKENEENISLDEMFQKIEDHEFGFIGIWPVKNGNTIYLNLEEAKMGIDFSDDNDIRKYVKNEHEAVEYAKNIWKPILNQRFPEYTVVLPRNTSLWFNDPEYN